jgi:cysteine desulfurase
VALSTGSACTSATVEPSHVLQALGLSRQKAQSSVRFGLGRFNTGEEVDYASAKVMEAVRRIRELGLSGWG